MTATPSPTTAPAPASRWNDALAIAGFVSAFIFSGVGLVLSIVAFVQGHRARQRTGLSLAGIIISAIHLLVDIFFISIVVAGIVTALQYCVPSEATAQVSVLCTAR